MEVALRPSVHVKNLAFLASSAGMLATVACAQASAEQRVEALRSLYEVELTSFAVEDQPQLAADAGAAAEPADATAAESEAAEPPVPTTTRVELDILVSNTADEALPGLTVELEQVGSDGVVKLERQLWLDVSQVGPGAEARITYPLEDVEYHEGDAFAVSIRSPVPPDERQAYREFASGGTDTAGT